MTSNPDNVLFNKKDINNKLVPSGIGMGAKVIPGLDGEARSSLLFSVKISSPAGSILTEKHCIP